MSRSVKKVLSRMGLVAALVAVCIVVLSAKVRAEGVIFLYALSDTNSIEEQLVKDACRFYGLECRSILVDGGGPKRDLHKQIIASNAKALIITASALSAVDEEILLGLEGSAGRNPLKILVYGIDDKTNIAKLYSLSGGLIKGCRRNSGVSRDVSIVVSDRQGDVALELSGLEFKSNLKDSYQLDTGENSDATTIMKVVEDTREYAIFLRQVVRNCEVFYQAQLWPASTSDEASWKNYREEFIGMAPIMMFMKYALGDYCWHRKGDYANLIIDDPWLREPYGFVRYQGLLKAMESANFHTTIAFVPWNYDRSEPHVVALFRKFPERLSVCIHGNNHDHSEFTPPSVMSGQQWPKSILDEQALDIKQGIARMEQFSTREGIPYDRVMVFPHGAYGEPTLDVLRKFNLWATVNGNNIPAGAKKPKSRDFYLRPETLDYANFLSLRRYRTHTITKADIARELFLDNPIVFYEHHDYFQPGIDRFNVIASTVNSIQRDVKWCSIGEIVEHMYLEKIRTEGERDILMSSANILLKNSDDSSLTYHIRKKEDSPPAVMRLLLNNKPYPYDYQDNELSTHISLASGESAKIRIEYIGEYSDVKIGLDKGDIRVWLLRRLSDFRDGMASKSSLGRSVIALYYSRREIEELGLVIITFVLSVPILFIGIVYLWHRRKH